MSIKLKKALEDISESGGIFNDGVNSIDFEIISSIYMGIKNIGISTNDVVSIRITSMHKLIEKHNIKKNDDIENQIFINDLFDLIDDSIENLSKNDIEDMIIEHGNKLKVDDEIDNMKRREIDYILYQNIKDRVLNNDNELEKEKEFEIK